MYNRRKDRKPIKVRVVLTVTIDPEDYRVEYGEPNASIAEVREYVATAAQDAAQSALNIVFAEVQR